MTRLRDDLREHYAREADRFPVLPGLRASVVARAQEQTRAKRKLAWVPPAVAIVLAVAIIGGLLAAGAFRRSHNVVYIDVSWTRLYHDIASLKADSDLVVSGRVVRSTPVTGNPPATDFTFSVDAVLHARDGQRALAGTTIVIHQTGGIQNGQTYEVRDDPLFKVGEKDVLFLHQYVSGRYVVLGGPSGRFLVGADGMVRPVNDEGVTLTATEEGAFDKQVASS